MRQMLLVAVLVAPVQALADDYPSDAGGKDRLCAAIGDTPNIAVGPRDRMFFNEECSCVPGKGCGYAGAPRWRAQLQRFAEAQAVENQRKATKEAQRKERWRKITPARKATAEARAAFWKCTDEAGVICAQELITLRDACEANGLRQVWGDGRNGGPGDECYKR